MQALLPGSVSLAAQGKVGRSRVWHSVPHSSRTKPGSHTADAPPRGTALLPFQVRVQMS